MRPLILAGVALSAAVGSAWAQGTDARSRPPRDYNGQVQFHDVPLDVGNPLEAKPLEPGQPVAPAAGPSAPTTPGALLNSPMGRPPLTTRGSDSRRDAGRTGSLIPGADREEERPPSGWGWLADEILNKKKAPDGEAASSEDPSKPTEGQPGETSGTAVATNSRPEETDHESAHRFAVDGRVFESPVVDRWAVDDPGREAAAQETDRVWPEESALDAGLELWGEPGDSSPARESWAPSALPTKTHDWTLSPANEPAAPEPERPSLMRGEAGRVSAPDPGLWAPGRGADRPSVLRPSVGSSSPESSPWGGLGSAGSLSPMSLEPVAPMGLSPTPNLVEPSSVSAASTTPSLGGMGTEAERARPKTLPW